MSIPYGYRVEDGKGIIEPREAAQVEELFRFYLDGATLGSLSERTGIPKATSGIRNMLTNSIYLGTQLYPRIIDDDLFRKVGEKRKRDKALYKRPPRAKPVPGPQVSFIIKEEEQHYDDPFREARYLYTLIEEKEQTDG